MTIPVSNVDVVTDTFGSWVQKTNQIAGILTANAVTVDTTSTGSVSTGNGFVNGIFGACTLVASTLRGGNVAVSNTLLIDGNVIVNGDLSVNGTVSFDDFVVGSDLVPTPNNTWRVGLPGNTWSAGYFTNTYSNTVHAGGFVINTSGFSGTANNAAHLGNIAATNYVRTSGDFTITGVHTHNANLALGAGLVAGGNTGVNGYFLKSTGSGVEWAIPSVANTAPAGVDSSIQFHDGGILGGTSTFTFNKNNGEMAVPAQVRVGNSSVNVTINSTAFSGTVNATNITGGTLSNTVLSGTYNITANNASHLGGVISTSYVNTSGTYTLSGPITFSANVTLNSRLIAGGGPGTSGQVLKSTGTGVEWGSVAAGSAAAGSDTQIQFNDAGSLNGDAGLTYNKTTDTLTVSNTISLGGLATINSTSYTGTVATATNATNLGGQPASYYRDAGNINAGTLANTRLSGTYGITATNAAQLNNQGPAYYTDITGRLGYTPVNLAGDTMTGDLLTTSQAIGAGNGNAGEKRLRMWNSSTNAYWYLSSAGGTIGLYDVTSATTRFTTDTSGNMTVTGNFNCGGLNASQLAYGTVPVARLGSSGTRDSTTYLRGDNTWATISTASGVTSFQTSLSGLSPSTSSTGAVTLSGTLGIGSGGTGATTAAGARTNLGTLAKAGDVATGDMIFNSSIFANNSTIYFAQNPSTAISNPGAGNATIGGSLQYNAQGGTLHLSKSSSAPLRVNQNNSNDNMVDWYYQGTAIAAVQMIGAGSSVNYASGSDYRIKLNLEPIANAVSIVEAVPVYKFNWKREPDGVKSSGFVAHEAQQYVPEAVSGVKDGKEMQQMDYSRMVPTLWAAVQELSARVKELEAQLNSKV